MTSQSHALAALVKRFYGFEPQKTEEATICAALTEAASLMEGLDTGIVLDFLSFFLRYVVPIWFDAMPEQEKQGHLEHFFGVRAAHPQWCTMVALSEAFISPQGLVDTFGPCAERDPARLATKDPKSNVIGIVKERLEPFVVGDGFRDVARELISSVDADIMRVVDAVAMLPLRMANAVRDAPVGVFDAPTLTRSIARQSLSACVAAEERHGRRSKELWSALVYKAVKMGQAVGVAEAWVDQLLPLADSASEKEQAVHAELLTSLPLPALEGTMCGMVRVLLGRSDLPAKQKQAVLCVLLRPTVASPDSRAAVRSVMFNKLLLMRTLSPNAAVLIVGALAVADPGGNANLCMVLVQLWKQRHFIQRTDAAQQAYITRALLTAMANLSQQDMELYDGLVGDILEGVSTHLGSALQGVRLEGMRVGEAFAKAMGQSLSFDELNGLRDEDAATADRPTEQPEQGEHKPDAVMAKEQENGVAPAVQAADAVRFDEDDDLQPYDLSDDEEDLDTVARPRYLRRILEFLRVKDEEDAYDRQSTALREASALVRSRPPDLPDLSCALARDLLTLDNRFNMEGFGALRRDALVSVMATDPERVIPMLVLYVFDRNVSYGTRLEILDLLRDTARDLAGRQAKEKEESTKPSLLLEEGPRVQGKRSIVPVKPDTALEGSVVTEQRGLESKTRRWGYRRGEAPRVIKNAFGPVAAKCFFRPLLNEIVRSSTPVIPDDMPPLLPGPSPRETATSWIRDTDMALLLGKALQALTTMVECCSPFPDTPTLAEDLLVLAWPLRSNPFPEVRRAVLMVVTCALMYMGTERLLSPSRFGVPMQALTDWVVLTREMDVDEGCREVASVMIEGVTGAKLTEGQSRVTAAKGGALPAH